MEEIYMSNAPLDAQGSDPVVPDDAGIGSDVFDPLRPDIIPDNPLGDDKVDHPL